jgi:hypothetical protein
MLSINMETFDGVFLSTYTSPAVLRFSASQIKGLLTNWYQTFTLLPISYVWAFTIEILEETAILESRSCYTLLAAFV